MKVYTIRLPDGSLPLPVTHNILALTKAIDEAGIKLERIHYVDSRGNRPCNIVFNYCNLLRAIKGSISTHIGCYTNKLAAEIIELELIN